MITISDGTLHLMIIDCHLLYSTKKFSGAGWNTCQKWSEQQGRWNEANDKQINQASDRKNQMKWTPSGWPVSKWSEWLAIEWQPSEASNNKGESKRATSKWIEQQRSKVSLLSYWCMKSWISRSRPAWDAVCWCSISIKCHGRKVTITVAKGLSGFVL